MLPWESTWFDKNMIERLHDVTWWLDGALTIFAIWAAFQYYGMARRAVQRLKR